MREQIAIVDLFSGPGGLGEGFSSLPGPDGRARFRIEVSIEKEASAHRTLRLRAFLRQFGTDFPPEYHDFLNGHIPEPDWETLYPREWSAACDEARCLELGTPEADSFLARRIAEIRAHHGGRTVLIGGPPCQAYSLAGRSRNVGKKDYDPTSDQKNFLYEQYVKVVSDLQPAVFVMENVKGMLSSSVGGKQIFRQVMTDLRNAAGPDSYRLVALSSSKPLDVDPEPSDFIVRVEEHGVAQARHRVIIVGIRNDIAAAVPVDLLPRLARRGPQATVGHMIGALGKLRSGLSSADGAAAWASSVDAACDAVDRGTTGFRPEERAAILKALADVRNGLASGDITRRSGQSGCNLGPGCPEDLRNWIHDPALIRLPNHETKGGPGRRSVLLRGERIDLSRRTPDRLTLRGSRGLRAAA